MRAAEGVTRAVGARRGSRQQRRRRADNTDSVMRAVGVRSGGCSNDRGGDVIPWTAGGGQCNKSDGGATNNATGASGDDDNNQLDWVANFAMKAGSR